jgi:uncharacterized membrane protein
MKPLSKYFINGLILIVPLAITIFVITEILSFTDGVLGRYLPVYFPGVGLITVVVMILVVGWLSSYWVLKKIIGYGESLVNKIPIVKIIYNGVKHLSTAVFESKNLFNHVVMVPYPHPGVMAMGFVMADVPKELQKQLGDDYICVFIPWSLNMTSGSNIFIPKKDAVYLNISGESALQYMLTAGAVMPRSNGTEQNYVEDMEANTEKKGIEEK